MKYITIMFTRFCDLRSSLLYCSCGQKFTHCSIALAEEPDIYYSFNIKGFAVETMEKCRRKGVKDFCSLRITVTDASYELISYRLDCIKERKAELSYSKLGVVCALLHIPYSAKNRFFCSGFVASLLFDSNAVKLRKKPSSYLPYTLLTELVTTPDLGEFCFA